MLNFPNAKINLGLHIVSKRDDGFHEIETVFYPVGLSDILEFVPNEEKMSFTSGGISIPGNPNDNLCMKAYLMLKDDFNISYADIHLHKIIPIGAGLGGGSSDGAFMLSMANEYFSLGLSNEKLKEYALQLGSDCAFFIENKPCLAKGRGEKLSPVEPGLSAYRIVLIYPRIHVSTADAYAGVKPQIPELPLEEIMKLPAEKWKDMLVNDFEKTVFQKFPVIKEIKQQLYNAGAVYAAMSGSGSAVYGLFKEKPEDLKMFSEYFVWES
jgi:4-diphosphocytidyl-2-C-methyl-D-erythritol kinase